MASRTRRQLFELLEEKQEPFLLDAYLIENGCSIKRLQRLSSHGFKRRGAAFGFLRSVLTKLVHGKPLSLDNKSMESGRLSVFGCCSGLNSRDFGGDHQWRCIEMEEEDCKQLSPVSVLKMHDTRLKEENQSSTSSFDSPRDDTASSAFDLCIESKKLLFDCVMEAEERDCAGHHVCLRADIRAKRVHERVLSWQRLNGDESSISELLGSDISEFRHDWSQFRPEAAELGGEIEAVVFDEIVDQVVLEILGSNCT